MFSNMFCKVKPGMCRMSMNGIAVKTSTGYKVYDVNTGTLVNCMDFVFDIGDEWFFCVPTNSLSKGDIILASGKPAAVIKVEDNAITAFRYEDSTIVTLVPEHFMFLGNSYLYSKIVSLFSMADNAGSVDTSNVMQYLMMSEMMKGENGSSNKLMPFFMMGMMNGNNPFSGLMSAMAPATSDAMLASAT